MGQGGPKGGCRRGMCPLPCEAQKAEISVLSKSHLSNSSGGLYIITDLWASGKLASYPGHEGGGEKAAWYLLHTHARSTCTPTKPGAPNMTVYFPHFPPVYVSKLLCVIQMNCAIASESTDWRVSYAPTDDAIRW